MSGCGTWRRLQGGIYRPHGSRHTENRDTHLPPQWKRWCRASASQKGLVLAMVVIERKDDCDLHLPYVAIAHHSRVSAATALHAAEVHMNCLIFFSLAIVERPYARGRQTRPLATSIFRFDRQRLSDVVVREKNTFAATCIESRRPMVCRGLHKYLYTPSISGVDLSLRRNHSTGCRMWHRRTIIIALPRH